MLLSPRARPLPAASRRAQSNIRQLQQLVMILMSAEGVVLSLSAAAYVVWLLRRVSVQRAALFTVFLTIPNGFIKQLANKNIKLSAEEDDSDGGRLAAGVAGGRLPPPCQATAEAGCPCVACPEHLMHFQVSTPNSGPADEGDAKPEAQQPADRERDKAGRRAGSEAGGLASRRNSITGTAALGPAPTPRPGKGIRFSVEDAPGGCQAALAGGPEVSGPSYAGRLQQLLAGHLDAEEDQSVIASKILNGGRRWHLAVLCYWLSGRLAGWQGGAGPGPQAQPGMAAAQAVAPGRPGTRRHPPRPALPTCRRHAPAGKRLTKTGTDLYKMTWPLLAWALLIVVLYSVSFSKFSAVDAALRSLKMGERSSGQAARLGYLAGELVLSNVSGPGPARTAAGGGLFGRSSGRMLADEPG
jgi:hypothetical protein